MEENIQYNLGAKKSKKETNIAIMENQEELIEQVVGPDNMNLSTDGGPAVIQVVMDSKRKGKQQEKELDNLNEVDSKLLS